MVVHANQNEVILNRYKLEDSHWFFKGLRLILRNNLEKNVFNNDNLKILDIGCGSGANLKWLNEYGEAHGVDISEFAIECCRNRKLNNLQIASAEKLLYADNYFDLALSVQVFCNIPESDIKAWKEVYRVLKPGGYFISLLPAYNSLFGPHDAASGSFRRYNASYILKISKDCNLEVKKIAFYNTLLFPFIAFYRLMSKFLCKNTNRTKTDIKEVNPLVNSILSKIIQTEVFISNFVNFPYGLSILSIHKKAK